jgi:hypothetical protein
MNARSTNELEAIDQANDWLGSGAGPAPSHAHYTDVDAAYTEPAGERPELKPAAFVANARFSRERANESVLLVRSLGLLLAAGALAALVASHRDVSSGVFLSRARTALIESMLDHAERAERTAPAIARNSVLPGPDQATIPSPRLASRTSGSPSPSAPNPASGAGGGLPQTAAAGRQEDTSASPVSKKCRGQPDACLQDSTRKNPKTLGLAGKLAPKDFAPRPTSAAAVLLAPASAAAIASAAPAITGAAPARAATPGPAASWSPTSPASMPATSATVHPVTQAEIDKATKSNTVEMVKHAQAKVTKVDRAGVTLDNGHFIPIGGTFTSGERLLATDPSNEQIVTDRRTIVLF